MITNTNYEILNSSGNFVNFLGVEKSNKDSGLKITLENDNSIIVSDDHIFISSEKNIYANSLIPNITYLSTQEGDFYVKSIKKIKGGDFYDIVDSENYDFIGNGFINHNCSFLGSGDNFIAEEYLKRIEEEEIKVPIRQEYSDNNMWIWEDYIPGEEYVVTIDASAGHGEDHSTINILKIKEIIEENVVTKNGVSKKVKHKKQKAEQVAEYYGKLNPQNLAEISYQYGKAYGEPIMIVDVTNGYGVQTIEKLFEYGYPEDSIHYSEVQHKPTRDRLHGYVKKGQKHMPDGHNVTVDLIPGFFIGQNRGPVLLEMQRAIHLGDVIIRSMRLLNELKTFVNVPGSRVADHKRSFHDDSIMGLACGLYVLNYEMARFRQNKGNSKKVLDAMLLVNDKEAMERRRLEEEAKNPGNKTRKKPTPPNRVSNPNLKRYLENEWLFRGLKGN